MKIDEYGDHLVFSTGKRVYACLGTVGLSPLDGRVKYGFDQDRGDYSPDLTLAESLELADYMIEQWQQFRDQQAKKERR